MNRTEENCQRKHPHWFSSFAFLWRKSSALRNRMCCSICRACAGGLGLMVQREGLCGRTMRHSVIPAPITPICQQATATSSAQLIDTQCERFTGVRQSPWGNGPSPHIPDCNFQDHAQRTDVRSKLLLQVRYAPPQLRAKYKHWLRDGHQNGRLHIHISMEWSCGLAKRDAYARDGVNRHCPCPGTVSSSTTTTTTTHHPSPLPPPPPPGCPTNNFVLKKYGPNGIVHWTRRSVHATILQNGGNTSLGTSYPAHSKHKAMEASN